MDEALEHQAVCAPDDCPLVGDGARRPLQYGEGLMLNHPEDHSTDLPAFETSDQVAEEEEDSSAGKASARFISEVQNTIKTLEEAQRHESSNAQNRNEPGHDSPPFECPGCDETFADNIDLLVHAGAHNRSVESYVGRQRCFQAGRTQTVRGHFLEASGIDRITNLPCVTCVHHQDFGEPVVMQKVVSLKRSQHTQTTSREEHKSSLAELARRGHELRLKYDNQSDTAANAEHPILQEQPPKLEAPVREVHTRLLAESEQSAQAAYSQGLQVAMQHELDALELQEALIAARKKELQAKMSQLVVETSSGESRIPILHRSLLGRGKHVRW